jgi:histidinol phosphatase-like enzyme
MDLSMPKKIIIWDYDGTITGSQHPDDVTSKSKIILPNVEKTMKSENILNIICSGCKTPESELQNFDTQKIVEKFKDLMGTLPISIVTFSPAIGGVECYAIIKHESGDLEVRKIHDSLPYRHLIGQFKKPDIGMLLVIQNLLKEIFDSTLDTSRTIMIGDTWHDEEAAKNMGIPFMDAKFIHNPHTVSQQ